MNVSVTYNEYIPYTVEYTYNSRSAEKFISTFAVRYGWLLISFISNYEEK